jgi:osomolarity two-component system phosphorelay intermediate protein YPD1
VIHSASGNCKELSSLGHFLKGSSATLGVTKVQDACESIQHYGDLRDNKTGRVIEPEVALSKISAALKEAKEQYKEAEIWLRNWYSEAKAQGRITEEGEDD